MNFNRPLRSFLLPHISRILFEENMRSLFNSHFLAVSLLVIGASVRGLGQETAVQDKKHVSLQLVLERLKASLEKLRTIEYKAKVVRRGSTSQLNKEKKDYSLEYELSYTADGNLFYARNKFKGVDGKLYDDELAYDGSNFQRFGQRDGVLELTRNLRVHQPAQSQVIQPIVYPFCFMLSGSDQLDYPTLLNQSVWDRLAQEAVVKGEEVVNGRSSLVIEIDTKRLGQPYHYKVYLDKERQYYPIKIAVSSPLGPSNMDVDTLDVKTDRGNVVVPVRIEEKAYNPAGKLTISTNSRIDPATLKVNVAVDSRIFTIDPKRAWHAIFNEDKNTFVPASGAHHSGFQSGRNWKFWIISFNVIVGLVVAVALSKRLKSA